MKAKHVSRSLERHVKATREHTWKALLELIEQASGGHVVEGDPAPHGAGAVLHLRVPHAPAAPSLKGLSEPPPGGPLIETVLSYEPPWRRACSVTGPQTGLDLCHATFVLRDDKDECHLSWCVVVDPEPTAQGSAFLESKVAATDKLLDSVVESAERSDLL